MSASMLEKVNQVVIPGDVIGSLAGSSSGIRLGQGLIQNQENIVATKAGVLRHKPPDRFWVESNHKRYFPAVDDMVIGIVTEKHAESWKVDVGTHQPATLSIYSFEGGTKRNRPNLPVGSLVYARMTVANKDMEPEIACVSATGRAEGFGPLEGGYMFKCSLALARQCLAPDSVVLNALGEKIPYEVAVGLNGRIWVKAGSVDQTILVATAIQNSEHLSPSQIRTMVTELIQKHMRAKQNVV